MLYPQSKSWMIHYKKCLKHFGWNDCSIRLVDTSHLRAGNTGLVCGELVTQGNIIYVTLVVFSKMRNHKINTQRYCCVAITLLFVLILLLEACINPRFKQLIVKDTSLVSNLNSASTGLNCMTQIGATRGGGYMIGGTFIKVKYVL